MRSASIGCNFSLVCNLLAGSVKFGSFTLASVTFSSCRFKSELGVLDKLFLVVVLSVEPMNTIDFAGS